MIRRAASLVLILSGCAAPDRPGEALRVRLWPEGAGADLEVHLPARPASTGVAIVVCPGGGYIRHVMDREGYPIAEWLNANGIAAVLLRYRLPEGRPDIPHLDAHRAIRSVRARAKDWGLKHVGILGFSAGGHVASTAGTRFDPGKAGDPDPVERHSSRADFMVLVYPVVTMGGKAHALSKSKLLGPDPGEELVRRYSNETQVTGQTPPAFVTHARDDADVLPDHSRGFVAALNRHGVPVEYLEFPSGGHGFNGCRGPVWEEWKARCLDWLAARGFLRR